MLIDGESRSATGGRVLDAWDPYTGSRIAEFPPDASDSDIDDAVSAARQAFDRVWRAVSGVDRAA